MVKNCGNCVFFSEGHPNEQEMFGLGYGRCIVVLPDWAVECLNNESKDGYLQCSRVSVREGENCPAFQSKYGFPFTQLPPQD